MKILHVLPSIDPRGGGPMEGVLQCGLACQQMGHVVEVLTLDDPAADYVAGYPLGLHAIGPSHLGYRYNPRAVPWLKAHAHEYGAIVVNGLWQYHGLAAWRALSDQPVPYYVFTHGMLDPWFKKAYPLKHLKKWAYWPWAEYRLLRDARAVLFTCEEERRLARESFWLYKSREAVIAYGTGHPPSDGERQREAFLAAHEHLRGRRLLLFLSRIHRKKGCDLLLRAFAQAAAAQPDLHLVMAGPDQTGWLEELKPLAESLGIGARVSWPGMLQGDLKWGAFHAAEAYVLPSHQENFGIAVAEALACGLPVLISDKVNIWREVEAAGAGLVQPDTPEGTVALLQGWLALDATARATMRRNAAELFERQFTVGAMARSLMGLIERTRS